jgi:hypothetical protein
VFPAPKSIINKRFNLYQPPEAIDNRHFELRPGELSHQYWHGGTSSRRPPSSPQKTQSLLISSARFNTSSARLLRIPFVITPPFYAVPGLGSSDSVPVMSPAAPPEHLRNSPGQDWVTGLPSSGCHAHGRIALRFLVPITATGAATRRNARFSAT